MHAGWGERARRESCREQVRNPQKEGMINMNWPVEFNKTIASITKPTSHLPVLQRCGITALTLMAFVLAQRTQAVNPPPDGGYAGGNTAEGKTPFLSSLPVVSTRLSGSYPRAATPLARSTQLSALERFSPIPQTTTRQLVRGRF